MSFRWGIWGTGAISEKFANGLRSVPGATVGLVASRDGARAAQFATSYGGAATEGYDAGSFAGKVDAVYIATPTGLHAGHALDCLGAGIPVLVEKPFAATERQAFEVIAAAKRRQVFAMEALWTRFLPAARALAAHAADGSLGRVIAVQGSFAIANAPDPARSLFQASLGGGALRQYGIYPLALGQLVAGPAKLVAASGSRSAGGVDGTVTMEIEYENGTRGQFFASLETEAGNDFAVLGECGRVALAGPIFRPTGLRLKSFEPRRAGLTGHGGIATRIRNAPLAERAVQWLQHRSTGAGRARAVSFSGNGYGHQAAEAMRCIRMGLVESPMMPHADSIELARLIDEADAQVRR